VVLPRCGPPHRRPGGHDAQRPREAVLHARLPELVAGLHEVWDEAAEQDDGQSHDHPSLYVHDTKLAGGRCTVGTVPGVSRPRASPALEQAAGDLLRDEREGAVVAPVAVDVEVAAAQALVAEAELLHHAQTRRVLRPD